MKEGGTYKVVISKDREGGGVDEEAFGEGGGVEGVFAIGETGL